MKKLNFTVIILLLCNIAFAQFGEFGEIKLRGISYMPESSEFEESLNLSESITSLNTGQFNTAEFNFPIGVRLELTYSRYYALNLSNYISWGIGYSYLQSQITLNNSESTSPYGNRIGTINASVEINQSHYLVLPLKFHQLIPVKRRSGQRDDEILTAMQRTNDGGAFKFSAGVDLYYGFLEPTITQKISDNQEIASQLEISGNRLASNFTKFIIVPEISVDFLLAEKFSFGFSAGYPLQPLYKNDVVQIPTANSDEIAYQFEQDFENRFIISLGFCLRGGN